MDPLDQASTCYWAPEVFYDNGMFLMYYSVGNEVRMQIRVATADMPSGPFVDRGVRLTSEEFAIDPHVFEDDDGARYLFYATDFLSHERVGTGTVLDRMLGPLMLEGNPRPVTRARHDWQIYDPCRVEKGGARWHTVEGPYVLKRKGKYYEMFSAGNWKNDSYGVSYAVSDHLSGDTEWEQAADGLVILPILRSVPGAVIGPGHNSVTRGPDNLQEFCIYHRRAPDRDERVLAIDRLEWAGERMIVVGPTTTPQPLPIQPTVFGLFDDTQSCDPAGKWEILSGRWRVFDQSAIQEDGRGLAEARLGTFASCFIAEVSLRVLEVSRETGAVGVLLVDQDDRSLSFELVPGQKRALICARPLKPAGVKTILGELILSDRFDPAVDHLLRIEVDGRRIGISLSGSSGGWQGRAEGSPDSLRLFTCDAIGAFAGFSLTIGWQDLFTESDLSITDLGWKTTDAEGTWVLGNQRLICRPSPGHQAILTKGPLLGSCELVVSARLDDYVNEGYYGFFPAARNGSAGPLVRIARGERGWQLECGEDDHFIAFGLGANFTPESYQQFRFHKEADKLTIQHEALTIGEMVVPDCKAGVGLCASGVTAYFDSVRVTAIKP